MGFKDWLKKGLDDAKENAKSLPVIKLQYLGGHPTLKGNDVQFSKNPKTKEVRLNGTPMKIVGIQWTPQGARSVGKAAAGAIIGGVLTGGIGAIAGAALGARKKDVSMASVTVEDGGGQYVVYVKCDQAEFKKLAKIQDHV